MEVREVAKWVARIRKMAGDDEGAHSEEDEMRQAVLEAIATGDTDDPAGLAAEALRSGELNFSRWCA